MTDIEGEKGACEEVGAMVVRYSLGFVAEFLGLSDTYIYKQITVTDL